MNTKIDFTKYKHIIFDWNGILLDDLWLAVSVIDKMLRSRKIGVMNKELYCEVFDFPVYDYYKKIGFDFNNESFEKVGTEFINNYNKRQYECSLHKGSKEFLEHLKQKNIVLSVLSARLIESLNHNLEYYNISHLFTNISGLSDHYANGKNEIGKKLVDSLNFHKSETLLIGDTLHDSEVADEIGIDCFLIAAGHQSKNRLSSSNKPIFDDITYVAELFLAHKN